MNYNKFRSTNNQDSMPYCRQQKGNTKFKGHYRYFCRGQKNYKGLSIHPELIKILDNL